MFFTLQVFELLLGRRIHNLFIDDVNLDHEFVVRSLRKRDPKLPQLLIVGIQIKIQLVAMIQRFLQRFETRGNR